MNAVLETRLRLIVCAVALIFAATYTGTALGFRQLAMYAPLAVGAAMTLLLALAVARESLRLRSLRRGDETTFGRSFETASDAGEVEVNGPTLLLVAKYVGWTFCLVAAIAVAGIYVAAATFLLLVIRFDAGMRWRTSLYITIGTLALIGALQLLAGIRWPMGLFG
ncbi:MAG: hypothetical protein WBB07_24935 [Mycobacterium sp.]